jgi:hypothetical protein
VSFTTEGVHFGDETEEGVVHVFATVFSFFIFLLYFAWKRFGMSIKAEGRR